MIEKKILIGYLSVNGATRDVALFLKEEFVKAGFATDVHSLDQIINIEPYLGLILAAPIQGMKWLKGAMDFFHSHRHQYRNRVVGLVATSYLIKTARPRLRAQLADFFKNQPALQPHDLAHTFGGRLAAPLPWFARLLFGVPKDAPLDVIDWNEVRDWAGLFRQKIEQKAEYYARIQRGGFE